MSPRKIFILAIFFLSLESEKSFSQCPGGYTNATLDWDNKDYLHRGGGAPLYSVFVTPAMAQTQNFAFGTNRLTISTTIPVDLNGTGLYGEGVVHTGETGAYGTGADVAFKKIGSVISTITLTFLNEVRNVKFSVFDIDQEITFNPTATNALGVAQSITLTKPAGTVASIIPLTATYPSIGSNVASVTGTVPAANWTTGGGAGTAYANTSNAGTINIDIAGPVKTIVLNFSNDGNTNDFWLSDISACVLDPGFPTNYYTPYIRPFTGQPSYVLAVSQNRHVYMINPATGIADLLFTETDPLPAIQLNSLAYDPVNKVLYYVLDGSPSSPDLNKTLKKYDLNTGNSSVVVSDVTTLGFPTFVKGVEAASATFYNGSLYLGIEGNDGSAASNHLESIVWRIDVNASPITASQVFAKPADDGLGRIKHDWGDILINNTGTLISHATNQTVSGTDISSFSHYNMQTGVSTDYAALVSGVAGQLAQTWDGTIYYLNTGAALYNNNGTIGAQTPITTTPCSPAWTIAASDGTFFKPQSDFGDAPASYDPDPLSPAVNDKNCNTLTLRLGALWDKEWAKFSSPTANGDNTDAGGNDEDAISTVSIMSATGVSYNHVQPVTVLNNTGSNAILGGWLDYNANGTFEASEGRIITVPSSASPQVINILWSNLTVPVGTPNSFLRIRLVSSANTMTTSNPTGWYNDGETEDYLVVSQNSPLAIRLIDFTVGLSSEKKVLLNWAAYSDKDAAGFEIQRSKDNQNFEKAGWVAINQITTDTKYSFTDHTADEGLYYYRLKLVNNSGSNIFSYVKSIFLGQIDKGISIFPNPASGVAKLSFRSLKNIYGKIKIINLSGRVVNVTAITINKGNNIIPMDVSPLPPGVYIVELLTPDIKQTEKLTISH